MIKLKIKRINDEYCIMYKGSLVSVGMLYSIIDGMVSKEILNQIHSLGGKINFKINGKNIIVFQTEAEALKVIDYIDSLRIMNKF